MSCIFSFGKTIYPYSTETTPIENDANTRISFDNDENGNSAYHNKCSKTQTTLCYNRAGRSTTSQTAHH